MIVIPLAFFSFGCNVAAFLTIDFIAKIRITGALQNYITVPRHHGQLKKLCVRSCVRAQGVGGQEYTLIKLAVQKPYPEKLA